MGATAVVLASPTAWLIIGTRTVIQKKPRTIRQNKSSPNIYKLMASHVKMVISIAGIEDERIRLIILRGYSFTTPGMSDGDDLPHG